MNPEDFSEYLPECVNETPFRIGGHWDEQTLIMKKAPVDEQEPDDTIGGDDEIPWLL